jgi:hypothetical protein
LYFFREGKAPAEPHLYKELTPFVTAQQELRPPLPLNYLTFSEVSSIENFNFIKIN